MNSAETLLGRASRSLPPQLWFGVSAVFHYLGPAFAVLLFPSIGVLGVAWLRIASAAAIFAPWTRPWRIFQRADWRERRLFVALGLCLAAMNCSFYLALDRLPISLVAAIEFVGTIGVALYGLRNWRNLMALLLAFSGVFLLIDIKWASDPWGLFWAFLNGGLFVGYIVLGHRISCAGASGGVDRLGAAMAVAFLFVLPIGFQEALTALRDPVLLAAGIGVGICSSVIPYVCDQMAMSRLPRASFALLLALLPASATIIGIIVLAQMPGLRDILGIALVTAGVVLHRPPREAIPAGLCRTDEMWGELGMSGFDDLPHPEQLKLLHAAAQASLAFYDLPERSKAAMINLSENATFRVDAPDGRRWALRLHRKGYHSRNAIASELAWVAALRGGSKVITPLAVPGRDGELIQTAGIPGHAPRHAVLFDWETGSEPAETDLLEHFPTLGRVTGEMHNFTRSWTPPPGFERFTWDFETALGAQGHWGSWRDGMGMDSDKAALFQKAADRIRDRLAAFGKSPDRFGLVHCDMRLANLLLDGKTTKVIDFDDCGFSWYLYDCATALSFIEDRPDVPGLIAAWVAGYRDVAPLSAEEEAEIPTLVMLRRLLLVAWIGSHSQTDLAKSMGVAYTNNTVPLAHAFLKG
ncbi:hypothetical protein BH10PSE7_BH10PSE7_43170 [soil metagenome]